MLIIRNEQIEALKSDRQTKFIKKVYKYLIQDHNDKISSLQKNEIENIIILGIEKSALYKISSEKAITLYIVIMLILGIDFDTNPHYDWAKEILINEEYQESEKIQKLSQEI